MEIFPDDLNLVIRLQHDDVEAFDQAYQKYAGKLYAFGLKYLKSPADSEELVQNIFLKLWENRKTLRKDTSFKAYLFTIAYNDICKFFRKKKYYEQFILETFHNNPDGSYSIEGRIDSRSVLDKVQQLLEKLPEKQKKVFMESRLEGKTAKEIADDIGITPGTVDNYIMEVSKLLKKKLAAEELSMVLLFFFMMPF